MTFDVTLLPPTTPVGQALDLDLDEDYESLVMDVCAALAETDCRFRVSGFGQADWPVDVRYDLSTVIEQLPDALAALRQKKPTQLDFYGQGIERLVTLVPDDDSVLATCSAPHTDWVPNPATETLSYEEAERMLTRIASDFKMSLERTCPTVATLEPFVHW